MKYTLLKHRVTGERGVRINTENRYVYETESPEEYKKLRRLAMNNLNRDAIKSAYESCGMVRVKGNSGRYYWE